MWFIVLLSVLGCKPHCFVGAVWREDPLRTLIDRQTGVLGIFLMELQKEKTDYRALTGSTDQYVTI